MVKLIRFYSREYIGGLRTYERGKRKCDKCGKTFYAKTTGKYCLDCKNIK